MPPTKHVILIPDGAADLPIAELDDRTPFQAASTPNLDALARSATLGTAVTTPPGFTAGSDVCSMDLLGYDPRTYHTGRAPLEAAARDIQLNDTDWVFRLNLVTVSDDAPDHAGQARQARTDGADGASGGVMLDHSAGGLPDDQARRLLADLTAFWIERFPSVMAHAEPVPGVSYRNLFIDGSDTDYTDLETVPPHEIPGLAWRDHLPGAPSTSTAARFHDLIVSSHGFLSAHPVNQARRADGLNPANLAWLWGQGRRPTMPSFRERFGLAGAMLSPVDLLRGIGRLIGWDLLDAPGMTSYHDTDYAAQGDAAARALDRYDIVCCHIEAPDEAAHQGDSRTKVASIEAIDRLTLPPILERLSREPPWKLLVLPDHYTLVSTRKHDPTPVPFLIASSSVGPPADPSRRFTESDAFAAENLVDPGSGLMERFLSHT